MRLETPVLSAAVCKSSRILQSRAEFLDSLPVSCFTNALCQSVPGPPYAVPSLFEIGILITEFSVS